MRSRKIKSFLSHLAHSTAPISDSMALSRTPAEAARPWTTYTGTKLHCLETEVISVNNFAKGHTRRNSWRTADYSVKDV